MTNAIEPLTLEQQSALDSTARLTLVNAGPGSGKTRLFVEAVRNYLATWQDSAAGLAALSFTNVAQNEIANRLGGRLRWPHFVGTLDSFLLRFVVRPFGSTVGAAPGGIQLVPSPLDSEIEFPQVKVGTHPQDKISIYKVRYNQGTEISPTFKFAQPISGKMTDATGALAETIQRQKQLLWSKSGRITHSDTHYLASKILTEHPKVADVLAIRFPLILVDELQDTSWFLGRALLSLLRIDSIHSLVVGDPDQAIYEFGGATPAIFGEIVAVVGSKPYPLKVSPRCSIRVCNIATMLSQSGSVVTPREGAPEGSSILLVHTLEKPIPDAALIEKLVASAGPDDVAVLVRRNQTLSRLRGDETMAPFPGGSRLAQTIQHACYLLKCGYSQQANRIVGKAVAKLAFDEEVITATKLRANGVSPMRWRMAIFTVLSTAAETNAENWDDWLSELRTVLETELIKLTGKIHSLGQKLKRDTAGKIRRTMKAPESQSTWPPSYRFMTVHQAKGLGFLNVIFFQPKPHATYDPCPSGQWFGGESEEKRIAYVAATRARLRFVLCVHKKTYESMKALQAAFVELFTVQFLGKVE